MIKTIAEQRKDREAKMLRQQKQLNQMRALTCSTEFKEAVKIYLDNIKNLPIGDKEYLEAKTKNQNQFIERLYSFRNTSPVLFPIGISTEPTEIEAENLLRQMEEDSKNRRTLPLLPVGYYFDYIQGESFYHPAYIDWQAVSNKAKNIIIDYDESSLECAEQTFRHIIMSILLAFPQKSIHITFVNTKLSTSVNFFTSTLDNKIYTNISSIADCHTMLESLLKRITKLQTKYGASIEEINETTGKIVEPYELVVLLDDPDSEVGLQEQLIPLFEKGGYYGIYFLGLNNTQKISTTNNDNVLNHKNSYQKLDASVLNNWSKPQENGVIKTLSIANNNTWSKLAFNHINKSVNKKIELTFDWDNLSKNSYFETTSEIIAPIGYAENGTPFNFRLDVNKQHYHAFVIGSTGSGKSRFLHDIILSITTKYSPEDVELYLMDFKGIEFNCYKDIKHVRAVLVDRADEQITYEVIRDIKVKMEERQHILADSGASDVDEYNKMHFDNRLSQVILIADECQTLFLDRAKNSKLRNEVVDIIALIAQQGRAYGIHLLLATQSLANAPQLGREILNQISEHYILPCLPSDASRLVAEMHRNTTESIVATMQKGKGQCFYQGAEENVSFVFNYIEKGEIQSRFVSNVIQKAQEHKSNGQAYFSGSLQYALDEKITEFISTKGRKNIVASPGQEISIKQQPITIPLKDDEQENILLTGINDKHYVTRTTINILLSLIITSQKKGLDYRFLVFDCLDDEEAEYLDILDELEKTNRCQVIAPRKRCELLKQLCNDIATENVSPTFLVILGQERFRELKLNKEFEEAKNESLLSTIPIQNDFEAALSAMQNLSSLSLSANSSKNKITNTQDAIRYILDKGPSLGVHTILQVDKPENLLFPNDNYFNRQQLVDKYFVRVIMLRSEEQSSIKLTGGNVRLDQLEDDSRRLRAYYYDGMSDKYTLFTPYMLPQANLISNLIK